MPARSFVATGSADNVTSIASAAQPPDVNVDEIARDLDDNGVAGPGDQYELSEVVADAIGEHELSLSVVVLPGDAATGPAMQDLAKQLATDEGGVVLVLDDSDVAAWSTDHNSDQITGALTGLPGDNTAAAEQFVANLTDDGPPWGWIIAAALLLVAAVAVGGRWWERRRRRARDAGALAAEGRRLRERVAEMADDLLRLEPQVPLREDAKLADRFSRLAIEYRELTHDVARDPASRRAADRLAARVRAAGEQLEQLRGRIEPTAPTT